VECKLHRNLELLIVEPGIKMDSAISKTVVSMVMHHTKVRLVKFSLKTKVPLDLVN
jgi:hypothetical protein